MFYLLALAAPLGLFALYVASRPAAFRIQRSAAINAPPEAIVGFIDDFHRWSVWSPWEKVDPLMSRTFEGPGSGKGAVYRWRGNSKAGQGSMTVVESAPSRVEIDLEFLKPFPAKNKTTFTLEPEGAATRVTWTMEGQNAFAAKAFNVVMDMDKLVGKDFDAGLAALKTAAEKAA